MKICLCCVGPIALGLRGAKGASAEKICSCIFVVRKVDSVSFSLVSVHYEYPDIYFRIEKLGNNISVFIYENI